MLLRSGLLLVVFGIETTYTGQSQVNVDPEKRLFEGCVSCHPTRVYGNHLYLYCTGLLG